MRKGFFAPEEGSVKSRISLRSTRPLADSAFDERPAVNPATAGRCLLIYILPRIKSLPLCDFNSFSRFIAFARKSNSST